MDRASAACGLMLGCPPSPRSADSEASIPSRPSRSSEPSASAGGTAALGVVPVVCSKLKRWPYASAPTDPSGPMGPTKRAQGTPLLVSQRVDVRELGATYVRSFFTHLAVNAASPQHPEPGARRAPPAVPLRPLPQGSGGRAGHQSARGRCHLPVVLSVPEAALLRACTAPPP